MLNIINIFFLICIWHIPILVFFPVSDEPIRVSVHGAVHVSQAAGIVLWNHPRGARGSYGNPNPVHVPHSAAR